VGSVWEVSRPLKKGREEENKEEAVLGRSSIRRSKLRDLEMRNIEVIQVMQNAEELEVVRDVCEVLMSNYARCLS